MAETRTRKSILNAQVALLFALLGFLLSFISRPIFIEVLGVEVVGLRTTVGGFLSMLSLAELGIGTAIAVSLYKPLNEDDKDSISEIVSLQGWLYRIVAIIVLFAGVVLMLFFPSIFSSMEAPLWYAYAIYIAFLVSTLLSYTITYKSIVLSADQKGYKVALATQAMNILKNILQITVLLYGSGGYLFLYWICLEFLGSMFGIWWVNYMTYKEYPWLRLELNKGSRYIKKYPHILKNTASIFVHQFSGVALAQTTPLVMFAYVSLSAVGLYGNYMVIITSITTLISSLFNSLAAGIGSLVAEGDKKKSLSLLWEIISARFFWATVAIWGMLTFSQQFISIWLGEEYLLDLTTLYMIVFVTYLGLTRALDSFLTAHGLFHDVWAPLVEAGLNIGLSILLGYYWGLNGILAGVAISLLLIVRIWKPYYLFREGFKEPVISGYWRHFTKYPMICWGLSIVGVYCVEKLDLTYVNFWDFLFNVLLTAPVFTIVTAIVFWVTSEGFRNMMKRFWVILARRFSFLPQID